MRTPSAEGGTRNSPPVLCYHRIGGPLELGVTRVAAGTFRRQMETLARSGWRTLTLSDYAESLRTTHHAPRTFLLSFDDGYASLAEYAYPVLADLGFTATTFVITDFVGATNTWDVPYAFRRLPHLDWPTIEHWRGRGFDFQSHTARHARLTWLHDAPARDELERSRLTLTARLGADAGVAVAYPFGAADARVAALAAEVGYELGFGAMRGGAAVTPGRRPGVSRDALWLARVPVYSWDGFSVPLGLQDGLLGSVGRGAASFANRCAVGTSAMLALWNGLVGILRPAPQRGRQEDRAG